MTDRSVPAGAALAELRDDTAAARPPALAPRIGWLLRYARLTADGGAEVSRKDLIARLRDLGLPASHTKVHAAESGQRDSDLIRGYEQALGLAPAQLLSVVDNLCDGFTTAAPDTAVKRRSPGRVDVRSVSRVVEPLLRATPLNAEEWVDLAGHLRHPYAGGVPLPLLEPALDRLLTELAVAIDVGCMARYWALCQLASGPYGDVVLDRVRAFLAQPGVQRIYNIVSAVTSTPRPGVVTWLSELLEDRHDAMRMGAAQGLLYHHASDPVTDWSRIAPAALHALAETEPGSELHRWLTHLVGIFPRSLRAGLAVDHLPDPLQGVQRLGPMTSDNPAWVVAEDMVAAICSRVGVQPQQVMTRMLFEVLYDGRPVRRDTSLELLGAVPFRDAVFEALLAHGLGLPAGARRTRVLTMLADWDWAPQDSALVRGWGPEAGATSERARLSVRAAAGLGLDRRDVERAVARGGDDLRWVVRVAGLSGDPVLRVWAASDDPWLADASAWWLAVGPQRSR